MSTAQFKSNLIVGPNIGESRPPLWLSKAYRDFHQHVTDPEYPCFFGTRAEQSGHLYYSYAKHAQCPSLPQSLRQFIQIKQHSEHFDTNLVIFLEPERQQMSHRYYHDRFWRLLNHLHQHDQSEWPANTTTDPHDVAWEFSFGGEQFFVFSASPSYESRKSRNLGVCQIILMQPRSSFGILKTSDNGASVRANVRERIINWDTTGVHPDLGVFGDPVAREWKQYFLPDDMKPVTGKCPFRHKTKRDIGTHTPPLRRASSLGK